MRRGEKARLRNFTKKLRDTGSAGFADGPWEDTEIEDDAGLVSGPPPPGRRRRRGRRPGRRSLGERLLAWTATLALATFVIGVTGTWLSYQAQPRAYTALATPQDTREELQRVESRVTRMEKRLAHLLDPYIRTLNNLKMTLDDVHGQLADYFRQGERNEAAIRGLEERLAIVQARQSGTTEALARVEARQAATGSEVEALAAGLEVLATGQARLRQAAAGTAGSSSAMLAGEASAPAAGPGPGDGTADVAGDETSAAVQLASGRLAERIAGIADVAGSATPAPPPTVSSPGDTDPESSLLAELPLEPPASIGAPPRRQPAATDSTPEPGPAAGGTAPPETPSSPGDATGTALASAPAALATPSAPARAPRERAGDWAINIASYAKPGIARRKTAAMREQGVDVELVTAEVDGRTIYRARVFGFASRREATAAAAEIRARLGLEDTWITKR